VISLCYLFFWQAAFNAVDHFSFKPYFNFQGNMSTN
jgi:hypothetical protein